MLKRLIMSTVVAASLILNGGLALAQEAEDPFLIPMQNNLFLVPELTVPVGTTVTWVNWDLEVHDVVEVPNLAFISPIINYGEAWQMTFEVPGTYYYLCDLHAAMEAVLHVVG